jgi:DNA-binding beta-propeller fold protein YncE
VAAVVAVAGVVTAPGVAWAQEAPAGQRDVMVVSNNWAGTADLIDPRTYKRLARINVIPDRDERIAEIEADPARKTIFDFIAENIGEGHNQYVDDGFTSRDGRTVFFSRPSFADVVAIDLRTKRIRWRTEVDPARSDHMAISPDGRRLLVSSSTLASVAVLDTRTGAIVGRIPSGDSPHETKFGSRGRRIFHASIGTVYTDTDDPSQDATKGRRIFEIIDARTLRVIKRYDIGRELAKHGITASAAVRPMAISPDERFVYLQLSFLHGFVEFDLREERPLRIAVLPLTDASRNLPRTEYLLDSAHHGLGINRAGTKLCAAGTMSNYAAIVDRRTLRVDSVVRVGRVPYWSTATEDGRHCWVSVAGDDRVSVIAFRTGREVRRIRVGDHPQRMRPGTVRRGIL